MFGRLATFAINPLIRLRQTLRADVWSVKRVFQHVAIRNTDGCRSCHPRSGIRMASSRIPRRGAPQPESNGPSSAGLAGRIGEHEPDAVAGEGQHSVWRQRHGHLDRAIRQKERQTRES